MIRALSVCSRASLLNGKSLSKSKLINGSHGSIVMSGRMLSSLGSPMFPHRPRAELETFEEAIENSKKAKLNNNNGGPENKGFIDILADHGGKIALVVFGGIVALVYSYYLSGQDRNKIEDKISDEVFVEPYEIQELRYTNNMDVDSYNEISTQVKRAFPSGQATYKEFLKFLKQDVRVSPVPNIFMNPSGGSAEGSDRLVLRSTHLLDRIVIGLCATQQQQQQEQLAVSSNNNSTDNTTSSSNSPYSSQNTNDTPPPTTTTTTVSWMDTVLEVDLLLVMLNLTMRADAESRVQALFHLATLSDSFTQSSGGSSSDSTAMHSTTEENGMNTNTDNTSTTSTTTPTVISRGK